MENTISNQIQKYIKENPLAKETEIRSIFNVSRELISRIIHQTYTKEELNDFRYQRLNTNSDKIKEALLADESYSKISKTLKINPTKLIQIINSNKELLEIVNQKENEEKEKIENVSKDWIEGASLSHLMKKYNIGNTASASSSYISKMRSTHGSEKFPIRLENRLHIDDKIKKYNEMLVEGKTKGEISLLLGYKNLASMKSSFAAVKEKTNEDV